MSLAPASASVLRLRVGLQAMQHRTGLPVAFGGIVAESRKTFDIAALVGTQTTSLMGLTVHRGEGLGGKALATSRLALVDDYHQASGITHRYDWAVEPERLRSVVCLPVCQPGRPPLALAYLCSRHENALGPRILESVGGLIRAVADDLHLEREICRRTSAALAQTIRPIGSSTPQLTPEAHRELESIIASTCDENTRRDLKELLVRLAPTSEPFAPGAPALTSREVEVLTLAERGLSNADIAAELGLLLNTVKAYMKAAMSKMNASNRIKAARTARMHGLLGA